MRKFDITIFFINFTFNYNKLQKKILYLMIKVVLFLVIKITKISYKII